MNTPYVWQDGHICPWKNGVTHVMNPSLNYGVAAFEGIRFYNTERGPAVFRLQDHLDRLFYSMDVLNMEAGHTHSQLAHAIKELITLNKMTEGYIRPIAWFSDEMIGLHNIAESTASIQVALFDWKKSNPSSLSAHISPIRRIHPDTTDVRAKISGHYVNTHLALKHASEGGFDDAIMLDHEEFVAEASGANIFCVQKGHLFTPQRGAILPGITRNTVITLARSMGISVTACKIPPVSLLDSDEIFICGTAYEIIPVSRVNTTAIGACTPGPITALLQTAYHSAVHGLLPECKNWLTYVNVQV
ncbi:MAG: branched-chain amino acid transaminase [bacterium]|nr:branched-chain amino acid transaminase [bacterium]MDZ4285568.1 branched-chain amino acid transaminase [Candidatus Sungbacteria bacterium]